MAIKRDTVLFKAFIKNYWEYFRELEGEFLQTRKYVEFCKENNATFSIEYLKLYQAVCSEIDVVGKAMAKVANASFKPEDKQNNIYLIYITYFLHIKNKIFKNHCSNYKFLIHIFI